MSDITIFHNPRCSKSRAALALIRQRGIEPRIVDYLKHPPDAAELKAIIAKLGIEAQGLVRRGEEVFKSAYAGRALSGDEWIAAMVRDPILIERPIVVRGNRAVIGRPAEDVIKLL